MLLVVLLLLLLPRVRAKNAATSPPFIPQFVLGQVSVSKTANILVTALAALNVYDDHGVREPVYCIAGRSPPVKDGSFVKK